MKHLYLFFCVVLVLYTGTLVGKDRPDNPGKSSIHGGADSKPLLSKIGRAHV